MSGQGPERPERVELGDRDGGRPQGVSGWLRWTARTDHPTVTFAREVLLSVLGVALVGVLLFAVSGIWPPMVAVESGSMEPHMYRGDLVFVMEEHRLAPAFATAGTGVVTYREAAGRDTYRKFGDYGDVIVFSADGGGTTPVIHRARFWVDTGENWYDRADPDFVGGATACEVDEDPDTDTAMPNCPAPHAGFITKGDNVMTNRRYDQVAGISGPVRPTWIKGTAEVRIPWLGYVRLYFSESRALPAVALPVPDSGA